MSKKLGALLILSLSTVAAFPGAAQTDEVLSTRKIVNRVVPGYPRIARPLNLSGTVKLEALVSPAGTVKAIEVKGGNPVLVQAAESALHEWKWEKTDHETTEQIEFNFTP